MKIRALFSTVTLKNFSRSSTIGSPRKNDGFSPTTFGGNRRALSRYSIPQLTPLVTKSWETEGGWPFKKQIFKFCYKTEGFLKAIVGLEKKGRNSIIFWGA